MIALYLLTLTFARADYGGELLDYKDLMSLSPQERAAYIRETREVAADLEKIQMESEKEASAGKPAPEN